MLLWDCPSKRHSHCDLSQLMPLCCWARKLPCHPGMPCPLCAQVSGELSLSCCWRVTPADALALKLRAAREQLSQRQEVLALLAERCAAAAGAPGSPLQAAAGAQDVL